MARKNKKHNKVAIDKANGQIQESLLSSPTFQQTQYLTNPGFYVINPVPEQIVLPWERRQQIQFGRDLFAKLPIVSSAIQNKNHTAVGNAWQPVFKGLVTSDKDKQWVEAATDWLINDYYPNVNWMGSNYSFSDTLYLTGKDIDTEGGSLMLFRNTKSGLPRVQLIPTDKIGTRDNDLTVVGGTWDGYKIYDGIIFNSDNMPVALNILGETKEDDQQISLFNCQYLFEPAWDGAVHGISKIANCLTTLLDIRDINDLLKITVKNFSAKGIIHKNSKGAAPKGKRMIGLEVQQPSTALQVPGENTSKIYYESINKGGTEYISSLDGSDIQPFNFDRPSPNTEAFIFRISSEAVASMGWFVELVTPSRLNGTSVRSIQDQARKLIIWRQQTIERRAKAIVQYGLATAMQLGLIPMTDNKTWMRWTFNKPSELTVDSGYDNAAQIESLKMGISTKQEICARRGKDWKNVSNQTELELRDIFDRAKELAKDYDITEAEARDWLSNRGIDLIAPTVPEEDASTAPVEDTEQPQPAPKKQTIEDNDNEDSDQ